LQVLAEIIVYCVNNLLFLRFPLERLYSQTHKQKIACSARNLENALAGMTAVVVISVDEWERSKGYIIAVQEKTDFGQEWFAIFT
jgi:hypothetical protein